MCVEGSPTDEAGKVPPAGGEPDATASSSGPASAPGPLAEDAFVRSETKRLRRIAKELLPNENERDDLVQDVWLAALEHPPRERGRLSAWLRVVTNHAARRLWRKSRSREARERIVARSEAQPSVLDALEREAAKAELLNWIDSLQPPYREVVKLHFFEGASPCEIAERLSRPGATVRSQLKRGLEQLRARYDGRPECRKDPPTAAFGVCSVEIVLEEGAPAEIRAIAPRPLRRGETVEVRIHGVRGVLEIPIAEEQLGEDLKSLVRFRVTLPQGSNRIEIATSGGLHGERTLEIQGHTPLGVVGVKLR